MTLERYNSTVFLPSHPELVQSIEIPLRKSKKTQGVLNIVLYSAVPKCIIALVTLFVLRAYVVSHEPRVR